MDTEKLLSDMKARFSHNSSKEQLKQKYKSRLTFASQGGMWTINPQFLSMLASSSATTLILLDDFENPIKVDSKELMALSQERWNEQMNAWLVEYEELNKQR